MPGNRLKQPKGSSHTGSLVKFATQIVHVDDQFHLEKMVVNGTPHATSYNRLVMRTIE